MGHRDLATIGLYALMENLVNNALQSVIDVVAVREKAVAEELKKKNEEEANKPQ